MPDYPPKKGVSYSFTFPVMNGSGKLVSGATFTARELSKDGGAAVATTNAPVEIGTSGLYRQTLTATEMTCDDFTIRYVISGHPDVFVSGETVTRQLVDLPTPAQVNAEVVDALAVDTYTEPTAVPAATSSIKDKLGWLFMVTSNKRPTTALTDKVRNAADTADVATATLSDDGVTFTRGRYT